MSPRPQVPPSESSEYTEPCSASPVAAKGEGRQPLDDGQAGGVEVRAGPSAAKAAIEAAQAAGLRLIRAEGFPHGIRDCCSECQDVAWEECFIDGQCRHYLRPGDTAEQNSARMTRALEAGRSRLTASSEPGAEPKVERTNQELAANYEAVVAERERLKLALVEAVIPLEVIAGRDRVQPYKEMTRDLIAQVNASIEIVRASLSPSKGEGGPE